MCLLEESLPGLLIAKFSPKSSYLYTFQTSNLPKSISTNTSSNASITLSTASINNISSNGGFETLIPSNQKNAKIFKIQMDNEVKVSLIKQFALSCRFKSLYWSNNEQLTMFIEKETLNFFENHDFTKVSKTIHIPGLHNASLSPENNLIILHISDHKHSTNIARMFRYPNLNSNASISSIILPQGSKNVEFKWNPIGTAVIVIAEIETTGASYYDERVLFFMSMNGDSNNLNLKPASHSGSFYAIHDIAWNPNGKNFAVIHGSLPAEIHLFDLKCNVIFKFPKATRNILYFNPFGNILCTTAHGNAHGDVEMWDMENFKLISRFPVKTKTKCVWLPDGKHMMFAVTSPTLRTNNGYF